VSIIGATYLHGDTAVVVEGQPWRGYVRVRYPDGHTGIVGLRALRRPVAIPNAGPVQCGSCGVIVPAGHAQKTTPETDDLPLWVHVDRDICRRNTIPEGA
jgi:hypothetical protein